MVFGKLYVQGGIDPTYLAIEPLVTDPIPAGLQGIWVDDSQNALHVKSNKITLNDATNTTQLSETGLSDTYLSGGVENKEQISVGVLGVVETLSATDGSTYTNTDITSVNNTGVSEVLTAGNASTQYSSIGNVVSGTSTASTTTSIDVGGTYNNTITEGTTTTASYATYKALDTTNTNYGQVDITTNLSSNSAQVAVFASGVPTPPFPASNASVGISCSSPTNPIISLGQSSPFAPSYSTIIDKDGINQNNSAGTGFNLSTAQDLTLTCPVANKIIVPNGNDIDLSSTTGSVVHTTTYGKDGMESQDFLAGTYASSAQLTQSGGASQMFISSSNLAAASNQYLRLEATAGGNMNIEHNATAGRNLAISTNQGVSMTAGGGASIGMNNAIGLTSTNTQNFTTSQVGSATTPQYLFQNTNASTASYPAIKVDRTAPASATGDTIGSMSFWADNYAGATREFARMSVIAQQVGSAGTPTNIDGTFVFQTLVNDSFNTLLTLNGSSQQIEVGKEMDLNGNSITTASGNITLNASTSSGNGSIILTAKNTTGEIQLNAPNYVKVSSAIQVGVAPTYNFIQNDAIDIFDTSIATANTTATLGRDGVGFTRTNTTTSLSQSFNFQNDSASGGVINYQNTIGTNGMILTTNQSIELNTTSLKLANTTITTSFANHNAEIKATSTNVSTTTFLKLKLNGDDIWIPYFTTDPSA